MKVHGPEPETTIQPVELPPELAARDADSLMALPFLLDRLEDDSDQVKMWAAYHLVDRWHDDAPHFVERLWLSPVEEIRESAINLIGKHRLTAYAFPLLRLFTTEEGSLHASAALALGRMAYDAAEKPLLEWYEKLMAAQEPKIPEIECAVESLLLIRRGTYWNHLYARLERSLHNHSVFITIFRLLSEYANSPDEFRRIAVVYGQPRELFHDFHLSRILVDMAGRPGISRYFQSRLNGGYPLPVIYQECLRVLGDRDLDIPAQQLVEALETCKNNAGGMARFITIASALIEKIIPETEASKRILAFLEGCATWIPQWEEAILKIREIEYHLLLSLPLVALLHQVEDECLANPDDEALRITRIYQSPLLSPEFLRQILTLLATQDYPRERIKLGTSTMAGWLWDEEKDTLWRLFTDQLDGIDYPFEQVLPQPWGYQMRELLVRLADVLNDRFTAYLEAERNQAVDYALEVFRYRGDPSVVEMLLEHFDELYKSNYHQLLEVMTHFPDARFLEKLQAHYQEEEFDLMRLIAFICNIHGMQIPKQFAPPAASQPDAARSTNTLRLRCPDCDSSFQYSLEILYVNEECIEQRRVPEAKDLWISEPLFCKNCQAKIPFLPDDAYLEDLYAGMAANRMLHLAQGGEQPISPVRMISFPVWDKRTMNPAEFLLDAPEALSGSVETVDEVQYLFSLGSFHLEIGNWAEAKLALEKILAGPIRYPHALYYLGVIAFQEKNLHDARVYFSRLIESASPEDFDKELDNPLDMAEHYLKLLDKREFKRSQFQLISS